MNQSKNRHGRFGMTLAGSLACVLVMAGCAASGSTANAPTSTSGSKAADSAVEALLPASVRKSGELRIATNGGYPPFEFYDTDNKTLLGADVDLITAVAGLMGLKPVMTIEPFETHITGLVAGKQDVAIASMGDTAEREKQVDFVSYFQGGSSLLVPKGNPKKLSLENLCGSTIGVGAGTIYATTYLPDFSNTCTAAGKAAITVRVFKGNDDATLALSSGQVDSTISDYAPLTYTAAHSNNKFEVLKQQYKPIPWGIAMNKEDGMAKATEAAVQKLMDDGTYTKILKKWNIEAGAVTESAINQAAS